MRAVPTETRAMAQASVQTLALQHFVEELLCAERESRRARAREMSCSPSE